MSPVEAASGAPGVGSPRPWVGGVLAGGESLRMGTDKARLPWGGGTLLERALEALRPLVGPLAVSAGRVGRYADLLAPLGVAEVEDDPRHGDRPGPLAGLEALLAFAKARGGAGLLVVPCDAPRVDTALLATLLELAEGSDADAIWVADGGGDHPLVACWRPQCLDPVRAALGAGKRKVTAFLECPLPGGRRPRVQRIGHLELEERGLGADLLENVNEPSHWQRIRAERGNRAG